MKEKLLQLGLKNIEADVYLYLLEHGRNTPALISKDTGIKRPTVYAAADVLVNKGLVTEDLGGPSKYLMANPKDLEKIVIEHRKEVLEEEALVNALLPDLKTLAQSAKTPVPKIKYVREADLTDFLHKQSLVWNQSMLDHGETSWWGYNSGDLMQHKRYRDWIDWYWKNSSRKLELHLFSPPHEGEEKISKKKYERRHVKYWDEEYDSSQWILGDYIVFVVTKQKPQYLIQIKDAMMAESLRRTYRKLWSLL